MNITPTTDCVIMVTMTDNLVDWLNEEIGERGWTIRELARRASLSHVTISNVLNGNQRPGLNFCKGIAQALRISTEEVLRRAGHLNPEPPETAKISDLIREFSALSEEGQDYIILFTKAVLEEEREKRRQERMAITQITPQTTG